MTSTAAEQHPQFRAAGTTDDITTCGQCGKEGLSHTVIIEYLTPEGEHDGEDYLGSDCAARKLAWAYPGIPASRAARLITREAQAAARKSADAVANSEAFMAHYGPFIARQERPQERGDRGAYIREYGFRNPLSSFLLAEEAAGDHGLRVRRAAEALAWHREVIATGGRAALA